MTKKKEVTMELYRIMFPIDKRLPSIFEQIYQGTKSKQPYEILTAYHALNNAVSDLEWVLTSLEEPNSLQEDERIETADEYDKIFDGIKMNLKKAMSYIDAYMIDCNNDDSKFLAERIHNTASEALQGIGGLSVLKYAEKENVG